MVKAGWFFTATSTKAHFFRDDLSLCGKWGIGRVFGERLDEYVPFQKKCVACERVLYQEAVQRDPRDSLAAIQRGAARLTTKP